MYAYSYMYSVFPLIKVCVCNYKGKEDKKLLMEIPLIVKWWEGSGNRSRVERRHIFIVFSVF